MMMERLTRTEVQLLIFLCLILSLTGCLDYESEEVRLEISEGLGGKITFEFRGIRSTETETKSQQKEMAEFYTKDYLEFAKDFEHHIALENVEVTLLNKTETKCDATLVGDFDNLAQVVAAFAEEGEADYEIKKNGDRFYVNFNVEKGVSKFIMLYTGEVKESNAHKYDKDAHTMEWDLRKPDKREIRFALDLNSREQ